MHDQRFYDLIARELTPESSGTPLLLLDPKLNIRAMNDAYERATLRQRSDLIGACLFDAFPDNPDDPQASGMHNLGVSLDTAMRSGGTHNMWVQRYDIPDPVRAGGFLPKVWMPSNSPVRDHDELVGVVHRVEEITALSNALSAIAQAIEAGDGLSPTEQLHTLAAFSAALPSDDEQQRAMAAENDQLRRALATRDIIGQAKGMLMERYDLDAAGAFQLLVKLSQQTNTRVVDVAGKLVELDHPPGLQSR